MRKLTVLLLSGAILAITGGVSVVRADGFAILQCIGPGHPGVIGIGWFVTGVGTSFDTPEECVELKSCSKCVAAITKENLKLVDSNLSKANQDPFQTRMIFAESDDDEKDKHRGRDKDDD